MSLNFASRVLRRGRPQFHPIRACVSVASWLRDWTADRQREVRISDLQHRIRLAFAARNERRVRELAHEMFAECDARSDRQKARMERRIRNSLDPHARAVFDRVSQ